MHYTTQLLHSLNHSISTFLKALGKLFVLILALLVSNINNFAHADSMEFITSSATIFAHPHDLVVGPQNNFLYVADVNNNEIKVLNPYTLKLINAYGRNILNSPHDVCFDNQGRLLVADSGNGRLVRYDVENGKLGNPQTIISGLASPEGVTVSSSGIVYVTNTGRNTIISFDPQNKGSKKEITNLDIIRPHDIEIFGDKVIYLTDPGNNGIKLLNTTLKLSLTLRNEPYNFNEPKYIAIDQRQYLYVADQNNNQIKIINPQHHLIDSIKNYLFKNKITSFNHPEGVEVFNRHVWVSDTYNNRVVLFKLNP